MWSGSGDLLCVLPHFSTSRTVKRISFKYDIINLGQTRIKQTYLWRLRQQDHPKLWYQPSKKELFCHILDDLNNGSFKPPSLEGMILAKGWGEFHNDKINNLWSLSNVFGVIHRGTWDGWNMRFVEHKLRVRQIKNTEKYSVETELLRVRIMFQFGKWLPWCRWNLPLSRWGYNVMTVGSCETLATTEVVMRHRN